MALLQDDLEIVAGIDRDLVDAERVVMMIRLFDSCQNLKELRSMGRRFAADCGNYPISDSDRAVLREVYSECEKALIIQVEPSRGKQLAKSFET